MLRCARVHLGREDRDGAPTERASRGDAGLARRRRFGGSPAQLQFHPPRFSPIGSVVYVAGYAVDSTGVTGECDYKHSHSGSGRGGGYRIFTDYYQGVCSWDLFGNLLSQSFVTVPQAPVPNPPAPISEDGATITYDKDGAGDSTGQTGPTSGFVMHSAADYVWAAAAQITTDAATPISFQATLTSTGDRPLFPMGVTAGSGWGQTVTVLDDGCDGYSIQPGRTCTITFAYDGSGIVADAPSVVDTVSVASRRTRICRTPSPNRSW
jgi:hypothetical protein